MDMIIKFKKLDLIDKIQILATYFLRAVIFAAIIGEILNQRWSLLFATSLIFALTFLPSFIERRYKIYLPVEFELVIILFIYTSLFLGEVKSYYAKLWWWDIVLHTGSGLALGLAGFLIMYTLDRKSMIKASPVWIAIFSFSFGVAIGAIWEIFEFSMDVFFNLNMQKSGLTDTMLDLIVDSLGALIVSVIGYFYVKGNKTPLFTRMLQRFIKENPKFFEED
jgi:hypothetical protein